MEDMEELDTTENCGNLLSDVELIQEHCVELFSLRDFVIEPQVITTLLAFFQAGGQPERVVELLSGHYQGLGEYANLLGSWLADLELGETPSAESAQIQVGSANAYSHGNKDARRKLESCPTVRGCFEQTVSHIIQRQFSPEAADKIFEGENASEGIDWLPELIFHKSWRRLIYDLAEHFPNCLMLNFAVKLISDAGFQHEISNVNTAAQQLDIFSRVFLSSIEQMVAEWSKFGNCQHNEAYQRHFSELKKIASHSEHTFLYTQMLLNYVGWTHGDKRAAALCSSIAQQLRMTFDGHREDISAIHIGGIQACLDTIPEHIVQAMLTMLAKGLNPADITQLYQAYSEPNPPPIALIREPFFTDLLLESLFGANGPRLHEEHRPKYIYLLVYASSVAESKAKDGRRVQNKSELNSTQEQMQQLVKILFSPEDLLLSVKSLLRLIHLPILAAGLLHHLKSILLREDELLAAEPSPLHFILIDQVARSHPNLHSRVFKLLCELFEHQSGRNEVAEVIMERQRHVVDRFVHLLYTGMTIPVLEKMSSMFKAGHIDVSLVRHFGIEVLELVSPPYSPQFTNAFLPIISNREVFDRTTLDKYPFAKEFLLQCKL